MADPVIDLVAEAFSGGARLTDPGATGMRALLRELRSLPVLTAAERTAALAVARRGLLARDPVSSDVFVASVDLAGAGLWERLPIGLQTGATGSGLIYRRRAVVAAGAGGAADDVTVGIQPIVGTVAGAWTISDGWFDVTAGAAGGRTVELRGAVGGAGTLISGTLSAAAVGRQRFLVDTAAFPLLPATVLALRRSDSAIGGVLVVDYMGR